MRSPRVAMAVFVSTPMSRISAPRRARAGPAQVTTCAAPTNSRSTDLCHHVANPRETQRRLRLATTRVVAGVAVHRFVGLEFRPVKVGGKIGAPLHVTRGVDMDRL